MNAHHHNTTAAVEQCGGVFCILNDLRAGGWTDDVDRGGGTGDGIPQFCCQTGSPPHPVTMYHATR